jgi:acyl-CoA thioesterase-1
VPPPSPDAERLIQFLHPAKVLERLPGSSRMPDSTLAGLYGTSEEGFRGHAQDFAAAAEDAARRLLDDPELCRAVDALPFAAGDVVVAAGDSMTDDLQSWAEILRHVLRIRRPDDAVEVVNAGLSGDTSAHLLSRFTAVAAKQPDWLIVMIGTNDARRHGPAAEGPLLSDDESRRMLHALNRFASARTHAELVWITPPPVLEAQIAASAELAEDEVAWVDAEVAAKAELVRRQPGHIVDLREAFSPGRLPELLLPDGLHPSLEGQLAIASALVRTLASDM